MSLNINPLFNSIRTQSLALNEQNNDLLTLGKEIELIKEIRVKAHQDVQANQQILNWETDPNRELLDRLYALDYFADKDKIYRFETPEQTLTFLQHLQTYLSDRMDTHQLNKNKVHEAQTELRHFQQEILNIMRQLGECMAAVNRRM